MFSVEKSANDRIDIKVSGKLTSEDMRAMVDEMLSKSSGIQNGKMRIFIPRFDMPSMGAIGVELSRLPSLFGLIKAFDRAAVLADKKWVRKVSEVEGRMMPGLEIKAFDLDQGAEAEAWLSR